MKIEEIFINDYDKMNLFLAFFDEIKMEFNKIFGYDKEWLGKLIYYLKEIKSKNKECRNCEYNRFMAIEKFKKCEKCTNNPNYTNNFKKSSFNNERKIRK